MKATKYRIKPTEEQQQKLAVQFGCARFVYNDALAKKQATYKGDKTNLSRYDLQAMLPAMKSDEKTIWLKDAHSQVLQSALLNLDNAFKNFFAKRAKFPNFKKKHGKQSFQYPQGVKIEGNTIQLPKVGRVKIVLHREVIGKIKTVTISKDSVGKYYASVLMDDDSVTPDPLKHIESSVGLDMGIHDFVTTSDGEKVANLRFLKRGLKNLKRKQQSLSRKKKGSNSSAKAKLLVAKVHKRVADARNDFQHKLSHTLANENQVVCVEDLNIKGMTANRKLARHIQDLGWNSFTTKLGYKLADRAGTLVKIGRFYPSSKTCSFCGHKLEALPLNIRSWTCQDCGSHHDRDVNAAINIQQQGILKLKAEGFTASASGGKRNSRPVSGLVAAVEAGSPRL